MTNKVYDVRVYYKDSSEWDITGAKEVALLNHITDLAKKEGEEIFLYRHKDEDLMGGGLMIYLECSPGFLEKVKALPRFGGASEVAFDGTSYKQGELYRAWHYGPNKDSSLVPVTVTVPLDKSSRDPSWWSFHQAESGIFNYAYENGFSNKVLVTDRDEASRVINILCPPAFIDHIRHVDPALVVTSAATPEAASAKKPKPSKHGHFKI